MAMGDRTNNIRGSLADTTVPASDDTLSQLATPAGIAGQMRPEQVTVLPGVAAGPPPQVEIVLPAHNEQRDLGFNVRRLAAYLRSGFPFRTRITIAENGSTDDTWAVAQALAEELPEVRAVRMEQPGKGRAIRDCWLYSDADVLTFIDADLPFSLDGLLPLAAPLVSGHSDVAIGTRLARGARIIRGARREVFSRGYNLLLHAVLGVGFSDAQCGFKAIRADAARRLLPLTRDDAFFFDTELLVLAERAGLRVHEVPVDHIDDAESSVAMIPTALAHLRGIARLGWGLARGTVHVPTAGQPGVVPPHASRMPAQVLRFGIIGVASTIAYAAIYLVLRRMISAEAANVLTLFVTAVANTVANRRFTFGIRGRVNAARHQFQGLIVFIVGLAVTSAALAVLHLIWRRPGHPVEAIVLLAASGLATVLRFALYRTWVFRPRHAPPESLFAVDARTALSWQSSLRADQPSAVGAAQPDSVSDNI